MISTLGSGFLTKVIPYLTKGDLIMPGKAEFEAALKAVADWFVNNNIAVRDATSALGEFVKGLFDTILKTLFGV